MELTIEYPTLEDFEEMNQYALKEFGVPDESMVAPTIDNDLRVQSLEKDNFVCFKEGGTPIAWSLVLSTSKVNKDKFLQGKISEKQLFEISLETPSFESLYLFVAIVLPEYRQKGLAKKLMSHQIKYFQAKYKIVEFFAWIFSVEGENLVKSLERDNSIRIEYIKKI